MRTLLLTICFLFVIVGSGISQKRFERSQQSDLFISESQLEITIEMDIEEVLADLEERVGHQAKLSITENGEEKVFNIKITPRGKTRANTGVCSFPPLEVNFKKKAVAGSVFDGQNKLKLVTHCSNRTIAKSYVAQEYITYKQYNVLTDYSFRVRFLKVKYIDSGGSEEPFETVGIFIEDKDIMAQRNGKEMIKKGTKIFNQDQCVEETIDLFTVFQFFIANMDWGVTVGHNVKVLTNADKNELIPVPYDFDYSGIINAHYAKPPPGFGIDDVRSRKFRGLCREPGKYEKIFALFNDKRDELTKIYTESTFLPSKQLKPTLNFINTFYKIINDEKKSRNQILKSCPLNHQHKYAK